MFRTLLLLILPLSIINPLSSQQKFSQQLKHALYLGQIESGQVSVKPSLQLVSLQLQPQDSPPFPVLLSLQKDPYWQITTLQQIVKKAKIKHKIVLFADLSLSHPYATLTNP